MKRYVSNRRETPRMFRNDVLEVFSRVHWTVPLIIFVPIVAVFLYLGSGYYGLSTAQIGGYFLIGLFVWTFTEYSLHRFVFHYDPKSEWGRRVFWTFHGVHHDYPSDPLRLVMVPAVSLPLATAFYFLFVWFMDFALAAGILCFNVESEPELELLSERAVAAGKVAPVSLRINPDVDPKTHPYISTGLKKNKFGLDIDQSLDAYRLAASLPGIQPVGIDCHIGSQLTELSPFLDALDRLLVCLLYTSPSPRDRTRSRMPSSA